MCVLLEEAPSPPAMRTEDLVPLFFFFFLLIREKQGLRPVKRPRWTRIRSVKIISSLKTLRSVEEVLVRRSNPHFDSHMAPGERKVASLLFSLFLPSFRLPCLYCSCFFFFLLIPKKGRITEIRPPPLN